MSKEHDVALIYLREKNLFNRSLRLLASKMGFNQRGLWKDTMRGPRRFEITRGSLVSRESEETFAVSVFVYLLGYEIVRFLLRDQSVKIGRGGEPKAESQ